MTLTSLEEIFSSASRNASALPCTSALIKQLNARNAAGRHLAENVLELRGLLMRELRFALAAVAELGNIARLALVGDDLHVVARHRRSR